MVIQPVAIVLAAGKSMRMQSDRPKVLFPLAGRPLVMYVLETLKQVGAARKILVVGYQADEVRRALEHVEGVEFVLQAQQRGTGHAVLCCRQALENHSGPVIVLAGDQPLIRPQTLRRLLDEFARQPYSCILGSAIMEDPAGLGRIVRDEQGNFLRIVEQKDADEQEKTICEVNVSSYVFASRRLWEALAEISPDNAQQEWYLTDCIAVLRRQGHRVGALPVVTPVEAMGVNTPEQLAAIERIMRTSSSIH